ncbi:MAG: hypothetical protein IT539_00630 [Bradyrhizobiaceae bacterium]|nr:hypothetical protein [Bradyrhizobiaceae bacterium]
MTKNRFRVGESVRYTSNTVGRPGARDGYTIVRVLPPENGEQQYRIKSASEAHERVAQESQLERRS